MLPIEPLVTYTKSVEIWNQKHCRAPEGDLAVVFTGVLERPAGIPVESAKPCIVAEEIYPYLQVKAC